MALTDEERAELMADIQIETLYRMDRTAVATESHKKWLANLSEEARTKRRQDKLEYGRRRRDHWTAHKLKMRRQRKAALVDLFGNACHECGGTFPDVCFDFHHTNPTNKTSIVALMYQHKMETVLRELEDCVMLCANCHRVYHAPRTDRRVSEYRDAQARRMLAVARNVWGPRSRP